MKKFIVAVFFMVAFVQAQQKPDDLQKVKDALVLNVLYSQDLEKQNIRLNTAIQKIGEDFKLIKTIAQLDSLKKVYGIVEEKEQIKKGK
jgi:hypothetical protein